MRESEISLISIPATLYFAESDEGLWIEWFSRYVLQRFLKNITFNCGASEPFPQLITNMRFDSVLRVLLTENNCLNCGMWVFKRYPLIGCWDPYFGQWSTRVGWYGILICAVSHGISCNTCSHPGVISPSPGGPDGWACTEAHTESQKDVHGGINQHSNQRERRTTAVIFLSQRNRINPGQPRGFFQTQHPLTSFQGYKSQSPKIKINAVLTCLNHCPRRSLLPGVSCQRRALYVLLLSFTKLTPKLKNIYSQGGGPDVRPCWIAPTYLAQLLFSLYSRIWNVSSPCSIDCHNNTENTPQALKAWRAVVPSSTQ